MTFATARSALLRPLSVGIAAVIACTAPLVAQQMQAPGARDASRVTAGAYKADSDHTLVQWKVDHLGITPYFGIFGDVIGTLALDPKNPAAAKVDVTIPVAKVTTASSGLTSHLLRAPKEAGAKPDFFGASPADARFVSTSVVPGEAGKAKVNGNLTLNGVTKPVALDVEFYGAGKSPPQMGGGEQVGFEGRTKIKRSDFGIGFGVPMVSDEVDLEIVAAFIK